MTALKPTRAIVCFVSLAAFAAGFGIVAQTPRAADPERTRFAGPLAMNPPHIATDKDVKYDFDIVYVRAPRKTPDGRSKWAEVGDPRTMEPGADLMLLHPDGKEEVLVAVTENRRSARGTRPTPRTRRCGTAGTPTAGRSTSSSRSAPAGWKR